MLVGGVAWFFVGGDKVSELHRLDRLLAVLLTTYALRKAGHTVTTVTLFQIITGLTIEFAVDEWITQPDLLVPFIEARVQHSV